MALAQSLAGEWTGEVTQEGKADKFRYSITLEQTGDKVYGTSTSSNADGSGAAKFEVGGQLEGKLLVLQEVLQLEPKNARWCLKHIRLQLDESQASPTLSGTWEAQGCKPGTMKLAVRQLAVGSPAQSSLAPPSAITDVNLRFRNPQSAIGGTYYRQLVFYKILFDNWRRNPARAVSGEISYLEPDAKGHYETKRIEYQPEDVAFVKGLITDTYARIMRQEFYEGCGQDDCSWCRFLKHQQQVDSFADLEGEGLDD